jgi:Flp pilus assembly protein CpaB
MTGRKFLTLVVVCLACAWFVHSLDASLPLGESTQLLANKPVHWVTVLVATRDLAEGAVVKHPQKWFAEQRVNAKIAPEGSCCRFDEINYVALQRYVKLQKPIGAGEILTHEHIREPSLEEAISKNYPGRKPFIFRALWSHWGCGWIQPMSQVDIILRSEEPGAEPVHRTEMQRVLVWNVDWCNQDPSEPELTVLVTAVVFPEQAEQLLGAMAQGKLRIMLSRE